MRERMIRKAINDYVRQVVITDAESEAISVTREEEASKLQYGISHFTDMSFRASGRP